MLSSVLLFLNIGTARDGTDTFCSINAIWRRKAARPWQEALGKGIRDFKDASEDVKREINNQINNYEDKETGT
jgi:sec-independent protein translocase protein TatA